MVRLEAGSVVALRMYDLGRAIDIDALASAAGGDVDRPQFPASRGGGLRLAQAQEVGPRQAPVASPIPAVALPCDAAGAESLYLFAVRGDGDVMALDND